MESELIALLQSNRGVFDETFNTVGALVKEFTSGEKEDQVMQTQELEKDTDKDALLKPKKHVKLTADLA